MSQSEPSSSVPIGAPAGAVASGSVTPVALEALQAILAPLAKVAVDQGVQFNQMEELLKQAMVQAAVQATRQGEGEPAPVSRLSVITGIHRKEVKRLLEPTAPAQLAASVTPAAELFTRWLTSRDWQGPDGKPLALPRRPSPDDSPNFEMLARSITTDVHPRTLLDELIRLELVAHDLETDRVVLRADSFVPAVQLQTMLGFLGANVGDHLAAARANVAASLRSAQQPDAAPIRPPFVEQALFADGLSAQSVTAAIEQTRLFWGTLLRTLAPELEQLEAQDQADGRPADQRIRIGLYCYAAPTLPLSSEKPSGQDD
jgi:hypothetical protein